MLVPAQPAVQQPAANAQGHAADVRDPVVDVGAAVEAGLDQLNGAAKCARADEDWQQPKAARARQRKGECREGCEVHELVAALRRRSQNTRKSYDFGDSRLSGKRRLIRGLGVPIRVCFAQLIASWGQSLRCLTVRAAHLKIPLAQHNQCSLRDIVILDIT